MSMLRRTFLRAFLSVPALGGAFKLPSPPAGEPAVLLNQFSVAGFRFYDGPRLIGRIRVGERLTLVAEPDNPYDEFAMVILRNGRKLGYVPRSDNRHLSRLLRQGATLTCEVAAADPTEVTWQMLKVRVWLESVRAV